MNQDKEFAEDALDGPWAAIANTADKIKAGAAYAHHLHCQTEWKNSSARGQHSERGGREEASAATAAEGIVAVMKSLADRLPSPVEVKLAERQSDIQRAAELVRNALAAVGEGASDRVEELKAIAEKLEAHSEELLRVGIVLWVPAEDRRFFENDES